MGRVTYASSRAFRRFRCVSMIRPTRTISTGTFSALRGGAEGALSWPAMTSCTSAGSPRTALLSAFRNVCALVQAAVCWLVVVPPVWLSTVQAGSGM